MRTRKWLPVLLILMLMVLSACSSGSSSPSATGASKSNQNSGSSSKNESGNNSGNSSSAHGSNGPSADGPLGKYNPPITLTTVMSNRVTTWPKTDSATDNRWTKAYLNDLGIKTTIQWAVPSDQYTDKLGVTIASGNLPDVMQVDPVTLAQLQSAGLIEDLSSVYQKYASPLLKKILTENGGYGLKQGTFNGKLMALPESDANLAGHVLAIRKDWLDNLGLSVPKTMDDLMKVAAAFTHDDPNKDGKNDTYALAATQQPNSWTHDLTGFFNGYGAYYQSWIKDANGKLVYGSIQPQMRTALLQLQKMYKDGEIDPEFAVKNVAKVTSDIDAGKIGMDYGSISVGSQWAALRSRDPKLQLAIIPLPGSGGKPAHPQVSASVGTFYVVKKGYAHPEALIKMANLLVDVWFGNQRNLYSQMITGTEAGQVYNYFQLAPILISDSNKNVNIYKKISPVIQNGSTPSGFTPEETSYYDDIMKYKKDPTFTQGWQFNNTFGPSGSLSVEAGYEDNNQYNINQFYGLATSTMKDKWATLTQMEEQVFDKIVMGSPISDFDKFVTDWNNMGGAQITKEVNDWYASQPKQ